MPGAPPADRGCNRAMTPRVPTAAAMPMACASQEPPTRPAAAAQASAKAARTSVSAAGDAAGRSRLAHSSAPARFASRPLCARARRAVVTRMGPVSRAHRTPRAANLATAKIARSRRASAPISSAVRPSTRASATRRLAPPAAATNMENASRALQERRAAIRAPTAKAAFRTTKCAPTSSARPRRTVAWGADPTTAAAAATGSETATRATSTCSAVWAAEAA